MYFVYNEGFFTIDSAQSIRYLMKKSRTIEIQMDNIKIRFGEKYHVQIYHSDQREREREHSHDFLMRPTSEI